VVVIARRHALAPGIIPCRRAAAGDNGAVRVNLMLEGQEGIEWEHWLALALAAEQAGLEGLFRSDHYRSIVRGDPAGSLDAWATLAALAARTERLRLGTLVSPVTFRHVSLLAKAVVTVDRISGGRVELGIGAGWYESEHLAYGFRFGTARERVDELDRQLLEITRQWIDADDIWPKPLQRPRPPIIVGGRAKPRTVRAAVRFADEYNMVTPTLAQAREGRAIVQDAAAAAGRAPLRLSMLAACVLGVDEREVKRRLEAWRVFTRRDDRPEFVGTVEQVSDELRRYEQAGVERVMLQHLVHEDVEMVALLGELAADLAEPV
jgi:alkanesulfonate monooxygenase SsuD/methylene tetrahydromethanopterin reductase-like flavin-dependent oxidoreductase (luciferase family)